MKLRKSLPLLVLASAPAFAQYESDPYEDAGYDEYAQSVPENVSYGYAQVLRAEEVVEIVRTRIPEERCEDTVEYRDSRRTTNGTVIGAIVREMTWQRAAGIGAMVAGLVLIQRA